MAPASASSLLTAEQRSHAFERRRRTVALGRPPLTDAAPGGFDRGCQLGLSPGVEQRGLRRRELGEHRFAPDDLIARFELDSLQPARHRRRYHEPLADACLPLFVDRDLQGTPFRTRKVHLDGIRP